MFKQAAAGTIHKAYLSTAQICSSTYLLLLLLLLSLFLYLWRKFYIMQML